LIYKKHGSPTPANRALYVQNSLYHFFSFILFSGCKNQNSAIPSGENIKVSILKDYTGNLKFTDILARSDQFIFLENAMINEGFYPENL